MIKIKKLVIGVRPGHRMFRISSLMGLLVDSVLGIRGEKPISEDYYQAISRSNDIGSVLLKNEDQGNHLHIDMDNVVFTKDYYDNEKTFEIEKIIGEFRSIWKCVNEVLKMKDIRRIGIMAEHQIKVEQETSSKKLINAFTSIKPLGHSAKVLLKYEDRALTKEGAIPNIKKSDFFNVIYEIYDSELDTNHPLEGHVNANIDCQKYYSPLFNGNVYDEVNKFKNEFLKKKAEFEDDLRDRGIV